MENEERIDLFEYYRADGKYSSATLFLLPSVKLSTRLTDFQALKKVGFVGCFLYDESEEFELFYKNSLLLVFCPSVSFHNEYWEEFVNVMKNYPNFITLNDYGYLCYGIWMKMYFPEVKTLFKLGKFSKFPKDFIKLLDDREQKICKMDANYRYGLEKRLGLDEEDLVEAELESIPAKESYTFKI